jgi:FMN phosphatase YigB (HAD superfamily)
MKQLIIFDLGGVLLREAEANLHKAESRELRELLSNRAAPLRIFNRAFEFAALVSSPDCKVEWLLGTRSGHEIVQVIKEHIHNPAYDTFFTDEHERVLIKHGIEFVLVPELLVALTEVIEEGVAFVNACKVRGIEIGIISNWDPASFAMMKRKLPELFSLFDESNIIIPQMAGSIKPSFEIYDYAVKKMNIDPAHCFFVDDSKANVEGAQKYGIKSVHHKNWKETKKELIRHGLKLKN